MRKKLVSIGIVSALTISMHLLPITFAGSGTALAACSDAAESGVNWSGCRKRNIIMSDFDFEGADFTRADLSSSDLRNTNLNDAKFVKANLVRASLMGASAMNADFSNAVASRTDFAGADLSNSNLSKAETNRVNFSKANLSGANLSKAEFARAIFSETNISSVNFDYSNLARSDFRGAKFDAPPSMESAYLFQTRIEGLDLSLVKGLTNWQIELACGDDSTILPEGIQRPASWPCKDLDES